MTEAYKPTVTQAPRASTIDRGDLSSGLNRSRNLSPRQIGARLVLAATLLGGGKIAMDTQTTVGQEPSAIPSIGASFVPSESPVPTDPITGLPCVTETKPTPEPSAAPSIIIEPAASASLTPEFSPAASASPNPETAANCTPPTTKKALENITTQQSESIRGDVEKGEIKSKHNQLWEKFGDDLSDPLPGDDFNMSKTYIEKYFKTIFNKNKGSMRGSQAAGVIAIMLYEYENTTNPESKNAILEFTDLLYDYAASIDLPGQNEQQERDGLAELIKTNLSYYIPVLA